MHAKRGVQVFLYETCTGMEMSATPSVQLKTPAALRATYKHLEPTRLGGGPWKSDCDRAAYFLSYCTVGPSNADGERNFTVQRGGLR